MVLLTVRMLPIEMVMKASDNGGAEGNKYGVLLIMMETVGTAIVRGMKTISVKLGPCCEMTLRGCGGERQRHRNKDRQKQKDITHRLLTRGDHVL